MDVDRAAAIHSNTGAYCFFKKYVLMALSDVPHNALHSIATLFHSLCWRVLVLDKSLMADEVFGIPWFLGPLSPLWLGCGIV